MRPTATPRPRASRSPLRRGLAHTTALAGLLAGAPALAQTAAPPPTLPNPSEGSVPALSGSAGITKSGSTLTVTVSPLAPRTIINWQTFNVGTGETAEFRDSSRTAPVPTDATPLAVLNRVVGPSGPASITQSQILGNIVSDANVSVYLLNPQGVLFGTGSNVNVGALVASTLDAADSQFLAGGGIDFTGNSSAKVEVANGATIRAVAGDRGVVALIAAAVDTRGSVVASGPVALVAATDATVNFDPGSPLSILIRKGSAIGTGMPIVARNTLTGSSVLIAGATRADVTDALLDVDAAVTATGAYEDDQGIVLVAGPTTTMSTAAVTFAAGAGADTSGALQLGLSGTLDSRVPVAGVATAGGIEVLARNGVVAGSATGAPVPAILTAVRAVKAHADAGSVVLSSVDAAAIDLTAASGDVTTGQLTATGGATSVSADTGRVTLAGIIATGGVVVSGTSLSLGTVSAGAATSLTATAGDLRVLSVDAAGSVLLDANGRVTTDSATARGIAADLTVTGTDIGGVETGTRATLMAGRDLTVTGTGQARLGPAGGGRDADVTARGIDATSLSGGTGNLEAVATSGDLVVGSAVSGGDMLLRARGTTGNLALTTVTSGGTLALEATGAVGNLSLTAAGAVGAARVRATGTIGAGTAVPATVASRDGAVDIRGGTIAIGTANAATTLTLRTSLGALGLTTGMAGGLASIDARTDAAIGTITAGAIDATAAGAFGATRLSATTGGGTTLAASGATLDIGAAAATMAGGSVRLSATGGTASVGAIDAGLDGALTATGRATLTGGATVGRDLSVTGSEIRLGGAPGAIQRAGRDASYTASTGSIAGATAATGLTIRANTDPTNGMAGGTIGTLVLDARTGIDLSGVTLAVGVPGAVAGSGSVGIRLADAGAPLTLGALDAGALQSIDAGYAVLSPLVVDGAVTLGDTTLVSGLSLRTPGEIRLASVAITGAGQGLRVEGTDGATTLEATGTLSTAGGDIAIVAPGAVRIADVRAGGSGAVAAGSTDATLAAGTLTGRQVRAEAAGGLTLDAVSTTGAAITGPTGGTAYLGSSAGGIRVAGTTQAAGDILIDAPGVIALGAVRSIGADVTFRSAATGLLTTGAVRGGGNVTLDRPGADARFESITADTGTIELSAPGHTVTVTGATGAGTDVRIAATTVALGAVAANGGRVMLTSANGTVTAGALSGTAVDVTSDGALVIGDVTARDLTIAVDARNGSATTGALAGRGDVVVAARDAVTVARVASSGASVDLRSSDAGLTLAGPVSAATTVLAAAVTGVTLDSVAAGAGDSALAATAGILRVNGTTVAGGSLRLSGATGVVTERVTSTGGSVDIVSSGGSVVAGALDAATYARILADGDATIAGLTARSADGAIVATRGGVTATGAIATANGFEARAAMAVVLRDTSSGAGDMAVTAGTTLTAGALAGRVISARAVGGVTLASLVASGVVTLVSDGGGIDIGGETRAAGDILIDAPGTIALGAVRSTGGAILFRPKAVAGSGAITAGLVSASGDVTAMRAAGIAFAGAGSDGGTVTLGSSGGAVRVAGDTSAGGAVLVDAATVSLGNVTAGSGGVMLMSGTGPLVAGGVRARGSVTVAGMADATVGTVDSTAGGIDLSSANGALSAGAVSAEGDITLGAQRQVVIAGVLSAGGSVRGTATTGSLTIAGPSSARTDISLIAAGSVVAGSVDVTNGAITLRSTGAGVTAGGVSAATGFTVDARGDATMAQIAVANGPAVIAATGDVTVRGTTSATNGIAANAGGAILLGDVGAVAGGVVLTAGGGGITATAIDAAGDIVATGRDDLSSGRVIARGGGVTLGSSLGSVTVNAVSAATGLAADAGERLAIGDAAAGGDARLTAGAIDLRTVAAETLNATARDGGLTLETADIGGMTTLATTGAGGDIVIARLTAGGPTSLNSVGNVRLGVLRGGVTTIRAAGDISGRGVGGVYAGLDADVAGLSLIAGGATAVGSIATSGDTAIDTVGTVRLAGPIAIGSDLRVTGGTVVLGNAAVPVVQAAAGRIDISSLTGGIVGLTGLTLRSDATGAGDRDLTLRSAGAIAFQPDTTLAGGTDRQSTVRVAAGSGSAIALGVVAARTIASPIAGAGMGRGLAHDGAVSIVRADTRDTLTITVSGASSPITVGTARVAAGDLSLDATGVLSTGTLDAPLGAVILAGASIASDAISAVAVDATARSGAALFTTIDADRIAAVAATDLRIARANARGTISLASLDGGVTGVATDTGFTGAMLTGGTVTVRAGSTAPARGAILLDMVTGSGGIDLAGRTVRAATLNASAGGVRVSTRADGVDAADRMLAIGTIDARDTIILATGGLAPSSTAPIRLDRATSTGGSIVIATAGGDLGSLNPAGRTTLSAVAGSISLDIGGSATLGSAVAGMGLTSVSDSLDVATATAGGALALSTRRGALVLGTGRAGGAAMLTSADTIAITAIDAATASITSARDTTIASVAATGDIALAGAARLVVGTISTPASLSLAGNAVTVDRLDGGRLTVAAGDGGAALGIARTRDDAVIRSRGAIAIGTLTAGSVLFDAVADVGATTITTGGSLMGTAGGNVSLDTVRSGGDVGLSAGRGLTIADVATPAGLALSGARIAVTAFDAGTLFGMAGSSGIDMRTGRVGGMATVRSAGGIDIGSLTAGGAALSAATDLNVDRIATTRSGADGAVMIATRSATIAVLDAGGDLTVDAAALALRDGRVGGDARITGGTVTLGRFAAKGGLSVTADTVVADTVNAGTAMAIRGRTVDLDDTSVGDSAAIDADVVSLGRLTTAQDMVLNARDTAVVGTAVIGASLTVTGRDVALAQTGVTGDAVVEGGTLAIGTMTTGGALTIGAARTAGIAMLDIGGGLNVTAGALTLGGARAGGNADLAIGSGVIGTLSADATRIASTGPLAIEQIDAGRALDVQASSASIVQAVARGGDIAITTLAGNLDLAMARASGGIALSSTGTATVADAVSAGGLYRIDAISILLGTGGSGVRQSAAGVALIARNGTIAAQGAMTLDALGGVTLIANGTGGGIAFVPETTIASRAGDVALTTTGVAAVGTVSAGAGAVRLAAADAVLTRGVSAQAVTLSNIASGGITRLGDAAVGNEAEFGSAGARFDLSNGEIGLVAAPLVTIAGGARDVVVGTVGLGAATGATRFAITTTGRIDMLGRFVATGSTPARTIAIGGDGAGGRSSVIRIAATQGDGGRVIADGAVLELSADRIGAGYDPDFLDPIGYRQGGGLTVEQVTRLYVARTTSTLYGASALGAVPYADGVLIRSGALKVDYTQYALFQNTGLPGGQRGIEIGSAGAGAVGGATLRLMAGGGGANAFALFGTVDGIGSSGAALLGAERVSADTGVSPAASRINGCTIGSGGGCLNTSIAQPALNLFDTSRAEIVRTADDLTLPFDPLIGTNNEALYLDSDTDGTGAPADCTGDKPCSTR